MNDIQKELFGLLLEVNDLCEEHGIEYYLIGGAALGALRNGSFLPWDDDIDLFITRDNWYKLYDLITENPDVLPENRKLVCFENSLYYRNPIARYIDTSTAVIHAAQSIGLPICLCHTSDIHCKNAFHLVFRFSHVVILSSIFLR